MCAGCKSRVLFWVFVLVVWRGGRGGRGECTKIAVNYVSIIEVDGLLTIARTDRCTLL